MPNGNVPTLSGPDLTTITDGQPHARLTVALRKAHTIGSTAKAKRSRTLGAAEAEPLPAELAACLADGRWGAWDLLGID
jgi:hypothetical protein